MLRQELAKKKLCKVINIFSKKEEIKQPIFKYSLRPQYQPKVTKTETTLKNKKCSIECNGIDKISAID